MTIEKIDLTDRAGVVAFSTLRSAASPADPYSGFSACHYTGDSPDHILACRSALCRMLGIAPERLVIPRQTHSANVAMIHGAGPSGIVQTPENVDALVTDQRGIALAVNTADCVPLIMFDTEAGVIAAVHSGWRGTVARIAAKAVEAMLQAGASPQHIHAAMGPCIGTCCFEVGEEVATHFRDMFPANIVTDIPGRKPHIDLGAAIAYTLTYCGISEENITLPPACSACHSDRLFSARRHGIHSGRTLTVIMLR